MMTKIVGIEQKVQGWQKFDNLYIVPCEKTLNCNYLRVYFFLKPSIKIRYFK
jgi:hypothetical protein